MSDEVYVFAQITAKPGHAHQVLTALTAIVAPSRAEPGCIRYILHRALDNPHLFCFYETWKDKAALTAHQNTPHFHTLNSIISPITDVVVTDHSLIM